MVEFMYSCSFWWWNIESESDSEEDECADDSDWDERPPAPKKAKTRANKPDTLMVQMNLKTIFENTAEAAIRIKASAAAHLELLSSFVNQCTSASTDSLTASLTTCKRQRKKKIKSIAKKIKTNFTSPRYPTVHFDGKVVKYLSGEAHDHEAVCLSGPTQMNHPQFLGAPLLDPPTGENTATVATSMLEAWEIDINILFAAVWDTTAVNTGVDHGACSYIERQKGTALLWCACRHHMAEIHMTHVFDAVRGATKGNY
jgi:hypothetical protein